MNFLKGFFSRSGEAGELVEFLWKAKLWFLIPLVVVLLAFGLLLIFAQATGVAAEVTGPVDKQVPEAAVSYLFLTPVQGDQSSLPRCQLRHELCQSVRRGGRQIVPYRLDSFPGELSGIFALEYCGFGGVPQKLAPGMANYV